MTAYGAPGAAITPDPKRDTTRDRKRRRSGRRARRKDPAYLAWLARRRCLVCSRWPVELHHVPPKSHAGDWHDRKTVPLCREHHRGASGWHGLGSSEAFRERWGIDLAAEVARLNGLYGEESC